MRGLSEIVSAGVLALGISGCSATQIGFDYQVLDGPKPIRQEQLLTKGKCVLGTVSGCMGKAAADLCMHYTDMNNNGKFDPMVDKQHYLTVYNGENNCFGPDDTTQLILRQDGEISYYFSK